MDSLLNTPHVCLEGETGGGGRLLFGWRLGEGGDWMVGGWGKGGR